MKLESWNVFAMKKETIMKTVANEFSVLYLYSILLGSLIYNKTSYFISSLCVLCAEILISKVTEVVK